MNNIIHVHDQLIKDYFTVCCCVIVNKNAFFKQFTWSKALLTEFLTVLLLICHWYVNFVLLLTLSIITCDSFKRSLSTGHLGPASLKIVGGNDSLSRWHIIIIVEIHRHLQSASPHVRESRIREIFAYVIHFLYIFLNKSFSPTNFSLLKGCYSVIQCRNPLLQFFCWKKYISQMMLINHVPVTSQALNIEVS